MREGKGRTSESRIPLFRTSRMRRIVASSDCLFRFTGGRRSIPLEIACGLQALVSCIAVVELMCMSSREDAYRPTQVWRV